MRPRGPVTKLDWSSRRGQNLRKSSLAPPAEGTPQGAEAGGEASAFGLGGPLGHLGPAMATFLLLGGEGQVAIIPNIFTQTEGGMKRGSLRVAGEPGLPWVPQAHCPPPQGHRGRISRIPALQSIASGRGRHIGLRRGPLPLEIPHEPPTGRGRHAPQLPRGQSERKESRSAPPPPGAAAESLWVAAATETAQTTLQ